MADDIAISVRNLTKKYRIFGHPGDRIKQALTFGRMRFHREFTALQDVSFEIKKGETVGIIGRNGSGKSTLLQLICGILKPTSGSVQVNGRISALLELGAGFNPEFTGRENVYFQGALMGFTKAQMDERFDEIAAFADIGEFIDQPVRTYSTGMFVRLAFAAISHVEADILVIDEALSVGDAVFVQKCMRHLADFHGHGSLIIVSHDLATISAVSDRAIWIEGGVRDIGPPSAVCENYITRSMGMRTPADFQDSRPCDDKSLKDRRESLLNSSQTRNDIELFSFNTSATSSGTGAATIIDAKMLSSTGIPFNYIVGGEEISLVILVRAHKPLTAPVIGFIVKNRLGLALIGDNTYLRYATTPVVTPQHAVLEARFVFRMPRLPVGDYSICITAADGIPGMHQTLHRINEAIVFHAQSSSVAQVLVGLPMKTIKLSLIREHAQ
ncbi:MAG: hypothetical protein A3F73_03765 [Gallionellales bacterium RIFCSPLOWO2_12_FULL_59_22]|nr:MAG: hypothetical protein A3H99_01085 [Gallionellales bacterium RIFCSPLOWO2_02_FULL_59_110]OGT01421.1 MAG: hypothetical protein A2Z65_13705 [Gallionellales bacterium RIFCSPLOWO2_02_58_13]OGT14500.1 MAG: hypothetical protein A3F73_03765 [Gallionellales bacterium RIFCSPLOWO2_12_FULL_59_22]